MKKKYLYTSVAAIALSLASYQLGRHQQTTQTQDNRVAYIENNDDKKKSVKTEKLTPEEVSAKEGISAEQIVVKITDQGYVTSHGDHFHYYNGKVPFDAILSEELIMKDPAYKLKDSDIINEVKDGYIIKVNGQYYLYLKEGVKPSNVRTKEELTKQQKEGHTNDTKGHSSKEKQRDAKISSSQSSAYRTDDGYVFKPTDVIDDLGDGFLVPHGDHFHFIPKKDLSPAELSAAQNYWNSKSKSGATAKPTANNKPMTNPSHTNSRTEANSNDLGSLLNQLYALPLSQRYREADGLVFDPAQISKRTESGVVVPHGDHFHFIPFARLSPLEREIAQSIPIGHSHIPEQPKLDSVKPIVDDKPNTTVETSKPSLGSSLKPHLSSETPKVSSLTYFGRQIMPYGKGLDGKPYDTSDGYVFSKDSIDTVDDSGLTARHGDHFHYIGFGELEGYELKQVEDWVKEQRTDVKPEPQPQPSQPKEEVTKPAFIAQMVIAKETRGGKVGYIIISDGVTHFYSRDELDLTQISFAEQQLMMASQNDYILDVVSPKGNELAPKFYLSAKAIKLHAAYATYDTGKSFIIPHVDHIHVVDYSWLTKEEIASVKYIMQHPKLRPSAWVGGHDDEIEDDHSHETETAKETTHVTPINDRSGLANWQILYSEEEIKEAKQEGRYVTEDGYIFSADDVLASGAVFNEETNQLGIPQPNSSNLRYLSKEDLSEKEWSDALKRYKEKSTDTSTEANTTTDKAESETSAPEVKKEKAIDVYNRAVAAKIIPVEQMPYNLAYAVGFKNDRIIVPHHDHYHNIVVHWFDDVFTAPEGYTLEELFATVKYYIENPDDRPTSSDGWGNSSPLAHGNTSEPKPAEPEEEEEVEEEEEEDEFEISLKAYASDFGMDLNTFRNKLISIALANKVSMEAFSYQPEAGTISFVSGTGETVTVSIKD
ncbi:pneumococcal-type histidine triad protein [Streptococcus fryi]